MMILMPNGSGGLFPIFFPDGDGDGPNIPNWVVVVWFILGVIASAIGTYLTYIDPIFHHDLSYWLISTYFTIMWVFLGPFSFILDFIIWMSH